MSSLTYTAHHLRYAIYNLCRYFTRLARFLWSHLWRQELFAILSLCSFLYDSLWHFVPSRLLS